MNLNSQVIVTSNIEETLTQLEALRTHERIVKIVEEERAFSVDDAKQVIAKAYMASEEMTVILLAAKIFSPIVQNKLLKIIEEPPKNKAFILLTQSKATILDTIKSRLPITVLSEKNTEEDLGLEVEALSLQSVYEFTQTHKRTNAKEMRIVVERIAKEAMFSQKFDLDERTLLLFSECYEALDMGSPPQFVLNALLLKLLARKKR
jgi:DNA polymerase-3 subunit delta'